MKYLATDEHLAIGLQSQRRSTVVRHARIERRVAAAVGIEPGDVDAREAFDRGELSANDHLSVGLHQDGVHRAIDAKAGIKGQVHVPRRAARLKTERVELQQETAARIIVLTRYNFFIICAFTPS